MIEDGGEEIAERLAQFGSHGFAVDHSKISVINTEHPRQVMLEGVEVLEVDEADMDEFEDIAPSESGDDVLQLAQFRRELTEIRELLIAA